MPAVLILPCPKLTLEGAEGGYWTATYVAGQH
jgi:hypothetical protein